MVNLGFVSSFGWPEARWREACAATGERVWLLYAAQSEQPCCRWDGIKPHKQRTSLAPGDRVDHHDNRNSANLAFCRRNGGGLPLRAIRVPIRGGRGDRDGRCGGAEGELRI